MIFFCVGIQDSVTKSAVWSLFPRLNYNAKRSCVLHIKVMYFEIKKSRLEITPRNDVTNSSNHPILSNFNWLTEITKKKKRIMMRYSAFFVSFSFLLVMFTFFIFIFFLASSCPENILHSYVDVNAPYCDLSYTLSSNNGRPLLFLNKLGIIIVIAVDRVKTVSLITCFAVGWSVHSLSTKFKHDLFLCNVWPLLSNMWPRQVKTHSRI